MNPRPNILIVVIDSLRRDHVSCYGYERKTTPNIDRLAEEGCLFETCITAAPFSPASYASIFSGLYPHQHGVNGDTVRVWPDTWPRLAERLKGSGYSTFLATANPFVGQATHAHLGFDHLLETYQRPWLMHKYAGAVRRARRCFGDRIADVLEPHHVRWPEMRSSSRIARWIGEQARRAAPPFFGVAILMDPHAPYDTRRREFCGSGPAVRRFFRRVNSGDTFTRLMAHSAALSPSELQIAIDLYDAEIRHADHCVGLVRDILHRESSLDETLLIVTADHGEAFGEHGVWGHGFCLNDCLTRVPLVVRHPRLFPAGTRSRALVQLPDLYDTCLALAGEAVAQSWNGLSLTQAADPAWEGREYAFSEFPVQTGTLSLMKNFNPDFEPGPWGKQMWSVRTRKWRYIEYDDGGHELYDLASDPQEQFSLHEERPDILEKLQEVLAEHRGRSRAGAAPGVRHSETVDPVVLDRLRALGYIE